MELEGYSRPMYNKLVHRWNEKINNSLLAYSVVNIFAKNYHNWLTYVEVIACYISVVF